MKAKITVRIPEIFEALIKMGCNTSKCKQSSMIITNGQISTILTEQMRGWKTDYQHSLNNIQKSLKKLFY